MQTSFDSTISTEEAAIERIALEWNGTLAGSANSSALFSLYLAMHDTRAGLKVAITDASDETDTVLKKLNALNHYRRESFASSKSAINNHLTQGQMRSSGASDSAWLHECLHPTPIHHRNDSTFIGEQVKENCSISTQWDLNLRNKHNLTANEINSVNTDPTILADIVEASQAML